MPSPRRIDRDRHIGAPPQDALLQPEALLRDLSRAEGWEGFPCQDRLEGFDARALESLWQAMPVLPLWYQAFR